MNNIKEKYWLWYMIVFLAAWNAVLRPNSLIPITPYYLLMPFILVLMASQVRFARRWIIWFAGFAAYGLAVGTAFGVPFSMQMAQLLKYLQLLTFFLLLTWLYRRAPRSSTRMGKLVAWLTLLVFAIAILQLLTNFEFPTVVNEESSLWLNTYFYTPNDLALFLCGVFCLVLCGNLSFWIKCLFFLAVTSLNLRNDAKAAILASIIMIAMYCCILICRKFSIKPVVALLLLMSLMLLTIFQLSDSRIEIGNSEFDFLQLFLDPFERIVNLDPYNLGGSIFDRTDALIYSMEAFKSTAWLGLGPSGSVYNLAQPNYELLTAKSLHNAIAEIFIEFGPIALVLFYLLLQPFKRAILSSKPTAEQTSLICLVVSSPLLSVSQSSGYISNYAFWLTAFLIWYPVSLRKQHTQYTTPSQCRALISPTHHLKLNS